MSSDYLIDTLARLARVPSAVPLGANTLIEPDHPILTAYVQEHLRPAFLDVGAFDVLDLPRNQFAVRFGTGDGPALALMAYTPTQHHNLMSDPWSGRIRTPVELGVDEPCLFGQGITQNKAHQACLLDLARRLVDESVRIDGTLLLCINNEGRSSHDCSWAMLDALPCRPDLVIQLFPTDFHVYVGNRGRTDIYVHVTGRATHSSQPPASGRVIDAAADIITRLRELDSSLISNTHPELGREQAVPYQVVYEPLAPHTLPSSAKITVDRRLLPGSDPHKAAEQLRAFLHGSHGCEVEVETGVTMLPAYLPQQERGVLRPLDEAIRRHVGAPRHEVYGGSFDAGGPASRGIPTAMFGVPGRGDLLGEDLVTLSAVRTESRVLYDMVANFFTRSSIVAD